MQLILTPAEAAKALKTRQQNVYKLLDEGVIPGYKESGEWKIPFPGLEKYAMDRAANEAAVRRMASGQ